MEDLFRRLGCSPSQIKLYLILLETGPSLASLLAKRSRIKRVTVYGALEGLVQSGLVETFRKNNVTYYQACDPEVIRNILELRLEDEQQFNRRAQKVIDELKEKRHETADIIEVKDVIRYYEGEEAVKTLIQENLNLPHKTQYCIGLSGYHALKISGDWKSYIKSRVKKGMKVLSIQADTEVGQEYKVRDKKELRETRLVPESKCPNEGELNIIGDRIILFSRQDNEAIGVKIINKKIAQILKKVFKLAWERAGNIDQS